MAHQSVQAVPRATFPDANRAILTGTEQVCVSVKRQPRNGTCERNQSEAMSHGIKREDRYEIADANDMDHIQQNLS